jgi:hypothetical protein
VIEDSLDTKFTSRAVHGETTSTHHPNIASMSIGMPLFGNGTTNDSSEEESR